jgi:hypothetical protein
MLRTLALLAPLMACGRTEFYPGQMREAAWNPGDCARMCDAATEQLVRDFAVPPKSIDCWAASFRDARSSAACGCVFEKTYGVAISGTFAAPVQTARCP